MKALFSNYLNNISSALKQLVNILKKDYDYVSVLATDSKGLLLQISRHSKTVTNDTMTSERGNVVRVYKDGLYSEYAFNEIDINNVEELAKDIKKQLDKQLNILKETNTKVFDTAILDDEELELLSESDCEILPEEANVEELVKEIISIQEDAFSKHDKLIECMINGQSTHVNKMFISEKRFLRQSYVYSEATLMMLFNKDGETKMAYEGLSDLSGPELFKGLKDKVDKCIKTGEELMSAERIEPGEYEIITSPEVSGLIAHEAFGHGVEMDMFVKGRALGADYLNKRVGSNLVTMHEGALCAENVTSYAFDDEGVLAGDVIEIDKGILKTGICDALSAKRLGVKPTGNGKRQNYEHKVYTRMTNTLFDSGEDELEDMIKSVKFGYLLEGMQSGMEDPKHWGIQCIIQRGKEIKDGKLTGKVVAPIIMTGYVPDLLGNISMASKDKGVFGTGACGKGHKEWVKVSDGGPYLKTIARLG